MTDQAPQGERTEKLIRLASLLTRGDDALVDEVRLAIAAPGEYVRRFGVQLAKRGIREPIADLPWIALVDCLRARGQLVEIDWRESPVDLLNQIERLVTPCLSENDVWPWTSEDELTWRSLNTWECLRAIGSRMAEHGMVLSYVDIRSDSYPLLLLRSMEFRAAESLARESKYGGILAAADLP